MKIKEAAEIYNKCLVMKQFKKFVESVKENTGEYKPSFENQLKYRFSSILDDLKDLVDAAIKEYEEVLDGEYKKD